MSRSETTGEQGRDIHVYKETDRQTYIQFDTESIDFDASVCVIFTACDAAPSDAERLLLTPTEHPWLHVLQPPSVHRFPQSPSLHPSLPPAFILCSILLCFPPSVPAVCLPPLILSFLFPSFCPSLFPASFLPSFLSSFLPYFPLSSLPPFLPSFLPSFVLSFHPNFLPSFLSLFLPSFLFSFLLFFFSSFFPFRPSFRPSFHLSFQ